MGVPIVRTLTILLAFAALTVAGVGCQKFHEHDTAAGHWPQEPDGFGGLKFDTTKDQTEKKIKLENCHTLEFPAAIKKAVGGKMNGTLECKASQKVAGKTFIANVQFSVPHDGESHFNRYLRRIWQGRLSLREKSLYQTVRPTASDRYA